MSPHVHTWWAGACEVASFTSLSNISAGAVVATRSVVAGVEFLTEDSSVAILTLAKESALQKHTHVIFKINEPERWNIGKQIWQEERLVKQK